MDADDDRAPIHAEVQGLIPWYITGALGSDERRRVENHMSGCDACRADLVRERRIGREVAEMPIDVELGWARMRQRLAADPPRRSRQPWVRLTRAVADRPRTIGLALVAQLVLLVSAVVAFSSVVRPAHYRALGDAPVMASANALILFRPDTRQQAAIRLLTDAEARIVDGPTVTGALLVHIAPGRRAAALDALKARQEIAVAEPIDR